LREEVLAGVRGSQFCSIRAEDVKAVAQSFQTQLNVTELLINLPAKIKQAEELEQQRTHKHEQMIAAREGGSI
jgi:hypothetical protein